LPIAIENLITLARLKLLMGRVRADRLSIGSGRVQIAPISMSSTQVSYLKGEVPLAVYSETNRELGIRFVESAEGMKTARELLISAARVLGK